MHGFRHPCGQQRLFKANGLHPDDIRPAALRLALHRTLPVVAHTKSAPTIPELHIHRLILGNLSDDCAFRVGDVDLACREDGAPFVRQPDAWGTAQLKPADART